MHGYREVILGATAMEYVQGRLANGLSLARGVLTAHDILAGSVRALIPLNAAKSTAERFKQGGLIRGPAAHDWYIGVVQEFLSNGREHLCVLENAMARSGDSGLDHFKSRVFVYGDEVYHVLDANEAAAQCIKLAILEAQSAWISLGFMIVAPPGSAQRTKRFSSSDLDWMAQSVKRIAVDAYDGEGWLIWERQVR